MSKTIPQLNTVPGGVAAANLFFEVARQITAGNFNGESEKISGDALLALLAGTSLTLNIIQRLNPTGAAYDPATTYTLYDFLDVAYQGGHYAYIGVAPSSGNAPTDSAYWLLISEDGADGASGLTQAQADLRYPLKTDTDPYPFYLTQAEAAALFSPIGGDAQGGLRYTLSLATTSPPSTGQVRFNNAAIASVTQIFIHESDRNSAAQSEILDAIAIGTRIQVAFESNEEIYAWFRVSGAVVDNGSDRTIPVTFISSAGVFVAEEVTLNFLQIQGAASSGGATGLKFTLNTATGDPVVGEIRSADLSAGGTIAISPTDVQTKSVADVLDRLKVGAIIEIAKDANNRVRGTITTDHTVGGGSFEIGSVRNYGAIASGNTVFLSIVSDAPSIVVGGTGRITCTAPRTYYVRNAGTRTGSLATEIDATTNTDLDAFGTITDCLNALKKLDFNGHPPTVSINGTFTVTNVNLPALVGTDTAQLKLEVNSIIQSSTDAFEFFGGVIETYQASTIWEIAGTGLVQLTASTVVKSLLFCSKGYLRYRDINIGLGSSTFGAIWANYGGLIENTGPYTISAGGANHLYINAKSDYRSQKKIITLINTPHFTNAFAVSDFGSLLVHTDATFVGSATGVRYNAFSRGQIITAGGANYFPGSSPGMPVPNATEAQIHAADYGGYG